MAVSRDHADAEPVGIGAAELGDVGGDLTFFELALFVEEAAQVVEDRGAGHGAQIEVVQGAIEPAVEACHGPYLTRSGRNGRFPFVALP